MQSCLCYHTVKRALLLKLAEAKNGTWDPRQAKCELYHSVTALPYLFSVFSKRIRLISSKQGVTFRVFLVQVDSSVSANRDEICFPLSPHSIHVANPTALAGLLTFRSHWGRGLPQEGEEEKLSQIGKVLPTWHSDCQTRNSCVQMRGQNEEKQNRI